ncbi:hypothetical protein F4604DRAFT_1595818, partial [Suillus subluteus]
GLDAGNHQDGWDPYAGLPSHWNHEDCNEGDPGYDEDELEVLCFLSFKMVLVNDQLSAGQVSVTATYITTLEVTGNKIPWRTKKVKKGSTDHLLR